MTKLWPAAFAGTMTRGILGSWTMAQLRCSHRRSSSLFHFPPITQNETRLINELLISFATTRRHIPHHVVLTQLQFLFSVLCPPLSCLLSSLFCSY